MGKRSRTEKIAQVSLELMRERTISQVELARRLYVEPRTIRTCITDLIDSGIVIDREQDHRGLIHSS